MFWGGGGVTLREYQVASLNDSIINIIYVPIVPGVKNDENNEKLKNDLCKFHELKATCVKTITNHTVGNNDKYTKSDMKGGRKVIYKSTPERFEYKGKKRVVYLGVKNVKYIKILGEYIPLKRLQ